MNGICPIEGCGSPLFCKKVCRYHYQKAYALRNKERINSARRQAYASRPEVRKARSQAYRDNNRAKVRAADKRRYVTRAERMNAHRKMHRLANLEQYREADRQRYERDTDKRKACVKETQRRNPGKYRAIRAKNRAQKLQATPAWLTEEHKAQIEQLYANRPEGCHVDHIIPLQGKSVCGLHVLWNLRFLPARENIRKGNRFV